MTTSPKLFLAVSISSCFCTVVDLEHNNSTSYLWQTGRARFLLTVLWREKMNDGLALFRLT